MAWDRIHARGRTLLREVRASREAWALFRPVVVDGPRGAHDERALDRMQLAWALQYDARPSDEELVRHVLEAEVEWRERDPWQGVGETLEIVAWLVARQRRVEDVWMLARAKAANFDTACGFDREHLLAAGVTRPLRYVRGSERPERDEVLALLLDEGGAPLYDQAEINAWHARRARTFQSSPDREEPAVGIDRALAIGDRSTARLFLDAWSARQEPSAEIG